MIIKTPSIVIKALNYSETSLIACLYTLEEGKVRIIAKGARRQKSPFAGKIESLNEIETIYIAGKSELRTLKECSISRSRMNIRSDLGRLNAGFRILCLLDETQAENDPNPSIYVIIT